MPSLEQVVAANPQFFNQSNANLFGDSNYKIHGHTLTITTCPGFSHNPLQTVNVHYAIDPQTYELRPISKDRKTHQPYVFVQPNNTGPVLTQWLNDDGSPNGPPTTNRPNQHEIQ